MVKYNVFKRRGIDIQNFTITGHKETRNINIRFVYYAVFSEFVHVILTNEGAGASFLTIILSHSIHFCSTNRTGKENNQTITLLESWDLKSVEKVNWAES